MRKEEQVAAALDVYWTDPDEDSGGVTDGLDPEIVHAVQLLQHTLRPPKPSPAFLGQLRETLIEEAEGLTSTGSMGHQRRRLRSLGLQAAAAAVFLIGLLTITPVRDTVVHAAGGIVKVIQNMEAGLTDRQREATHQSAHERNNAYLRAFVAQHRDPHALPPVWIQTYAPPPPTLAAAVAASQMIVWGHVDAVTFAVNPSGGMPIETSRVRVQQTIKGTSSEDIAVTQLGGPVAHGSGGALAELVDNELALPGDDVVLLLQRASANEPWHTIAGGVYFVRHGAVTGQSSEYYHLSGEAVERFIAHLSATDGHGG